MVEALLADHARDRRGQLADVPGIIDEVRAALGTAATSVPGAASVPGDSTPREARPAAEEWNEL